MIALAVLSSAVLPVFAVLVAAPAGPEEGCPSGRQVTDAMQARFPIALVMPDQQLPTRSDVLRVSLEPSPDGTSVRFALIDVRGEAQLRRTLAAPGRAQSVADCLALADTLASIVERYLGTIAYETTEPPLPAAQAQAPPTLIATAPPAPVNSAARPRAGLIMVGLDWRMPGATPSGQGEIAGRIGGAFELTRGTPRLAGLISVGAFLPRDNTLTDLRTATLHRFPIRVGAMLELPAGPGWVEPTIELGADLLMISSTAGGAFPAWQRTRLAPGVDAAIGYRLRLAGRVYIRPRVAIGFAAKRLDIGVPSMDTPGVPGSPVMPVFSTPWTSASFGIDTGVLFQ